jgi:hypothetical protein
MELWMTQLLIYYGKPDHHALKPDHHALLVSKGGSRSLLYKAYNAVRTPKTFETLFLLLYSVFTIARYTIDH